VRQRNVRSIQRRSDSKLTRNSNFHAKTASFGMVSRDLVAPKRAFQLCPARVNENDPDSRVARTRHAHQVEPIKSHARKHACMRPLAGDDVPRRRERCSNTVGQSSPAEFVILSFHQSNTHHRNGTKHRHVTRMRGIHCLSKDGVSPDRCRPPPGRRPKSGVRGRLTRGTVRAPARCSRKCAHGGARGSTS